MTGRAVSEPAGAERGILATRAVEKVWGRATLPEPFQSQQQAEGASGEPIGEIWFASPAALDSVLVKYLFTSAKLSVQVHPSDAQAQAGEEGKEECWLILDAEPGAKLAIGFREGIAPEEMRVAAQDGSIEDLLDWHEVSAGDFFYLPAGTVHAIGAGISLVEVQQSSDTTFRLYDYGRPRELHLERAIAVAKGQSYPAEMCRKISGSTEMLVSGPHFRLVRLVGQPDSAMSDAFAEPLLVLPLDGEVTLGSDKVPSGSCAHASGLAAFSFSDDAVSLLVSEAA